MSEDTNEYRGMKKFEEGVLYAAGLLAKYLDQPAQAAWIVKEAGLENADCSKMDDFDKEGLRAMKGEKGIKFGGL